MIFNAKDAKGIRKGTQRRFSFATFAANSAPVAFKIYRGLKAKAKNQPTLRVDKDVRFSYPRVSVLIHGQFPDTETTPQPYRDPARSNSVKWETGEE